MKTKNIVLSLIMVFALASCKKEADKNETEQDKTELKETFDVTFNLVIPKDDTFQLYYTEDKSLNFGDDRSVKCVIKGNETAQDVLFKLPADVLPTNIRLDFGKNMDQEVIKINSMKLKYLNKSFAVTFDDKNETIPHYFYFMDTQVKYDPAASTMTILNKKGQNREPLMWSNQLVSDELEKLYKN